MIFPTLTGVVKFDPTTGKQFKTKTATKAYTQYFAESLVAEAQNDDSIVAIHAAMGGGTGLNLFQKHFPDRCFDVGIAEQHAVTFAAGLATEGLKPFCAIYSSFLQRAYDQVCWIFLRGSSFSSRECRYLTGEQSFTNSNVISLFDKELGCGDGGIAGGA